MNTLKHKSALTTADFGRWPKVRVRTSHATNPDLDQKYGTLSCVLFHQEGLNIYIDGLVVPWYFRPEQITPLLRPAYALTDEEARQVFTLAFGHTPADAVSVIAQGSDGVAVCSGFDSVIITPDDFRITSIANPVDGMTVPKRVSAARVYQFLDGCGIDTMGYLSQGLAMPLDEAKATSPKEPFVTIERIAA